jgi:hypothetical protein
MGKVRLLSIGTADNATVTSEPFRMGGRQVRQGEGGRSITTLQVTGVFGSGNGDTVRFETCIASESGNFVIEPLDPLTIQNYIDASGEFQAAGTVNITTAPGMWGRFIFRAPSGTGDSSIEVWAAGAIETVSSSNLTLIP